MTTYIALLRAINLGSHNKVGMADLRALLTGLGLEDARSILQSGNLVFRSDGRTGPELERLLEDAARERLGLDTDFFVRTVAEWKAIVAANPFPEEAMRDPGHLVLMCLREAPAPGAAEAIQGTITGREVVRADGRQAYIIYPDGIGESKLTILRLEKGFGTRATGRNWNTVLKLLALVEN